MPYGNDHAHAGSHMAREIADQPRVLRSLFERTSAIHDQLRAVIPDPLSGIITVGRGSSDIAAGYGAYLWQLVSERPVVRADPTLWTRYRSPLRLSGWLVVAVSQSGRTPEIQTALTLMREQGARAIAVTNDSKSPLASAAEVVIDLAAGPEVAVPATKTFTGSLVAMTQIASALAALPWRRTDESRLVEVIQQLVDDPEPVQKVAQGQDCRETVHIGRGFTHFIALEAALKAQETSLVPARGFDVGDLLHGPIASLSRASLTVAYSVPGPTADDVLTGIAAAARGDSRTLLIAQAAAVAWDGPSILVTAEVPEPLGAIALAVRAQQLAFYLALSRGENPDNPRGLSKVTSTG